MTLQINIFAFKNRFPELVTAPDDEIQNCIDLAVQFHDESVWAERDYPLAIMLWAAHLLTLYKIYQARILAQGGAGAVGINLFTSSIGFGERHVSYGQRSMLSHNTTAYMGPGETNLSDTIYGSLYQQVRGRNIIPCLIV